MKHLHSIQHVPLCNVISCLVGGLLLLQTLKPVLADRREEHFENHVRPLLVKNCISCHGSSKQESGLDLSTYEGLVRGGDSGPALVIGQPEESLIVQALRHQSLEMPPNQRMDDALIEPIAAWISDGAYWPVNEVLKPGLQLSDADRQWWCLQEIKDPVPPDCKDADWCRNPIDQFILAKLRELNLNPSPEASPHQLARRLHFTLHGLPPDPKAVMDLHEETVGNDQYEKLLDKLLARPQYGENQSRYWLDLARYADSDGYRADAYRPAAQQYRQYVIDAFNQDKPYDRFVVEQLAGDELDSGNRESVVATMFLRHWIYEHNQRDVEGQWQEILDDVTETTADVFLALGMKCAKCHDHKYDPILQQDYFRLQAFFAALQPREDLMVGSPEALMAYDQQYATWEVATRDLRLELYQIENPVLLKHATREGFDKFVPEIKEMILKQPYQRSPREQQIAALAQRQYDLPYEKLEQWLDESSKQRRQQLIEQLSQFDHLKPAPLPTQEFVVTDVGSLAPDTFVPGDSTRTCVLPGVLNILDTRPMTIQPPPAGLKTSGRRLSLAKWIASPKNPLTARVLVNRVWEQHFGVGLVENASDFGRLGDPPSHPELLDWLASRFIEDGWSLKKLHRRILTSATFRQSSQHINLQAQQVDPENRWLWRANPRRLSGEEIVDASLKVTGELDQGHPRSIYEKVMRNKLHPVLSAFDFPDRIRSVSKRHQTTTSTQALMLMNNSWFQDRAEKLHALLKDQDSAALIAVAYQRIFSRAANAEEISQGLEFLQQYSQTISQSETDQQQVGKPSDPQPQEQARIALLHALMSSNEMFYVD